MRAQALEQMLSGAALDAETIAQAAAAVAKEISPLPHHGFTKSYIVDSLRVYLRRVLAQAVEQARDNVAA